MKRIQLIRIGNEPFASPLGPFKFYPIDDTLIGVAPAPELITIALAGIGLLLGIQHFRFARKVSRTGR